MTTELPIRCACGQLEGVASDVSASTGNHVICYCDDCQLFQHFLGSAARVLDAHGGTRIYQMSPGRFRVTSGKEHLACMRLTPGGIVRWYADCCNTPVGNTLATSKVPFVGVVTACFGNPDVKTLEAAFGPVKCGVNGRFALGNRDEVDAHDKAPLSLVWGFFGKMLKWRLRGDHKRSPFFDPETGKLSAVPKVLSEGELQDLKQKRQSFDRAAA
ncbi:MAG: DUF6151 family protein [Pseudomonadota bacterium]